MKMRLLLIAAVALSANAAKINFHTAESLTERLSDGEVGRRRLWDVKYNKPAPLHVAGEDYEFGDIFKCDAHWCTVGRMTWNHVININPGEFQEKVVTKTTRSSKTDVREATKSWSESFGTKTEIGSEVGGALGMFTAKLSIKTEISTNKSQAGSITTKEVNVLEKEQTVTVTQRYEGHDNEVRSYWMPVLEILDNDIIPQAWPTQTQLGTWDGSSQNPKRYLEQPTENYLVLIEGDSDDGILTRQKLPLIMWGNKREAFHDRGTGSNRDGSVWAPSSMGNNLYFGMFGAGGYGAPSGYTAVISEDDGKLFPSAFTKPNGFQMRWRDIGTGASGDRSIWHPTCPYGYAILGDVAIHNFSNSSVPTSSNFPGLRCIETKYLNMVVPTWYWKWNDGGSGGRHDGSIYNRSFKVGTQTVYFLGGGNGHGVPRGGTWPVFKPEMVRIKELN